MQISVSPILTGTTAEPAPDSGKPDETADAGSFFAQMNLFWKTENTEEMEQQPEAWIISNGSGLMPPDDTLELPLFGGDAADESLSDSTGISGPLLLGFEPETTTPIPDVSGLEASALESGIPGIETIEAGIATPLASSPGNEQSLKPQDAGAGAGHSIKEQESVEAEKGNANQRWDISRDPKMQGNNSGIHGAAKDEAGLQAIETAGKGIAQEHDNPGRHSQKSGDQAESAATGAKTWRSEMPEPSPGSSRETIDGEKVSAASGGFTNPNANPVPAGFKPGAGSLADGTGLTNDVLDRSLKSEATNRGEVPMAELSNEGAPDKGISFGGVQAKETGPAALPMRPETDQLFRDDIDLDVASDQPVENSGEENAACSDNGTGGEESGSDPRDPQRGRFFSEALHNRVSPAEYGKVAARSSELKSQAAVHYGAAAAHAAEMGSSVGAARRENGLPQTSDFMSQLAERIQVHLRDGKGEIRIQLKPDSFGRLEIRAENTGDGLTARIIAESAGIKSYLENNVQTLQQSLHDQGLKIDRIQVLIQENYGSAFSGHAPQSGHTGGQHNHGSGRSGGGHSISPRQAEEIIVDPSAWTALNPNVRFHTVA